MNSETYYRSIYMIKRDKMMNGQVFIYKELADLLKKNNIIDKAIDSI